ncbi:hypothetical protein G5714_008763 [Onychostoma macrolepis]|uniref:Ig-like domain-containing protein n=1 Tax=Onychostoma macrolepis TaxID=369639 RepID=A0A7J6CYW8_9TELE|nr:hypothetical protein G5714_008763 [Onychostoma macrolepis]
MQLKQSDKLRPTLTVKSQSSVFTGDTVTLSCDVEQLTGWTIIWRKDSNTDSTGDATKTIESVSVSDGGRYWCRAKRGNYYSEYSNAAEITVKERPKPVARVDPDRRVFRGETVTLTCHIQQTGVWQYSWNKDNKQVYRAGQNQNYIISSVDPSHGGVYSCRGSQSEAPTHTQKSDGVTLTVSDSPRSTLTVTPDSPVFTGETVTLTCVIESNHSDWRYEWHKDSVMLQTSDGYTVNRDTLTIRGANESDQGQYWCRGQRDERPQSSQSSSVSLSVTGVSPSVSLEVSPSRSQHFSSDSLSLSCEDQSNSAGWTVRRYTDRNTEDCSKQAGSTCRIVSLSTSDSGVYWCQSESGEKRHPLNITVHDGDVILESSVDPVIEGDTLTLHCLHRSTNSPILGADFYKDGSLIQNQTTGEMNITTVSKSHEGFYSCKTERERHPRAGSPSEVRFLSSASSVFFWQLVRICCRPSCCCSNAAERELPLLKTTASSP